MQFGPDGYLYISLRNLNTAQQRRVNRNRLIQLSLVDYDSAEIGLRAVDFRDQIAAQEELRVISGRRRSVEQMHAVIEAVGTNPEDWLPRFLSLKD